MRRLIYMAIVTLIAASLGSCKVRSQQYAKQHHGTVTYVQGGYSAVHDRAPIN